MTTTRRRAALPPMVKRPGWGYSRDGLWTFERQPSDVWELGFVPTDQVDFFPTLRDARLVTADPLAMIGLLKQRAATAWADRNRPEPERQRARRQWQILEHLTVWGQVPAYADHQQPDGRRCPWSGAPARFNGQCRSWRCGTVDTTQQHYHSLTAPDWR